MKNSFLLTLVLAIVIIGLTACRPTQEMAPETKSSELYSSYAGSEACAGCHSSTYNRFVESGHSYKLSKVENGMAPTFPFSTLPPIPNDDGLTDGDNTLGAPGSYFDVSYVIGGFHWKARFIDTNGYIVTGADTQYNYETDAWVAYSDGVVDKPYNCGKCHTTGWIPFDDGGKRQDNLPGMEGTFFQGGIHCEACHGPGAAHVKSSGDKSYITKDSSSELCGKCHTRDSANRIAASGGYIKHHEQYDELLGIDPDNAAAGGMGKHLQAGVGCNTCHDPHATTVKRDRSTYNGLIKECTDCHADKVIRTGPHSDAGFANSGLSGKKGRSISNCVHCHMPMIVKTAVGHGSVGTGPNVGDIRSHIFKVDTTKVDQFTPDGQFAYPWLTGASACKHCHNGVYFFNKSVPTSYKIHK